jgi:AraC-like DNA-binding protein/mannose-6-phosphate isomerase-like protein (cupin superfamily)
LIYSIDSGFFRAAARIKMSQRSINPDDYQDVARPVAVMSKDIAQGRTTGWHKHKRGQLVFAASGAIVVRTREGTWVIPPQRAVWVPPATEHETRTVGAVAMRTVYVAAKASVRLPEHCCVVNVTPLLRELILRAAGAAVNYDVRGAEGRVMRMILDEIESARALSLHLPTPSDKRLAQFCRAILKQPTRNERLADLVKPHGMSKRTAERLFVKETSMTFSRWRQQARLLSALTELAAGHPVKHVAFKSGYSSQSAFTSVFKQTFGTTPAKYFAATH